MTIIIGMVFITVSIFGRLFMDLSESETTHAVMFLCTGVILIGLDNIHRSLDKSIRNLK